MNKQFAASSLLFQKFGQTICVKFTGMSDQAYLSSLGEKAQECTHPISKYNHTTISSKLEQQRYALKGVVEKVVLCRIIHVMIALAANE
jgi:hypothetical protein